MKESDTTRSDQLHDARKVSVIVPFHNAEATLAQALESIAASTHRNIEVLLVDDCGTDRGVSIAEEFARKDGRFRLLRNPENKRVSFSRNRGLAAATGDFVLFVDADDRISPDWIGNLVKAAIATNDEIVIGKSRRFSDREESDYRMKGLNRRGELRFKELVLKDNSVVWNKLYSTVLLRRENLRFEEDLFIGEDLLFNFRAAGAARGIYYNDEGYYCYRMDNESSIMRSSTPEHYNSNLSRLLGILVECSNKMAGKNDSVLRKVAKDVLMNHYRCMQGPVDPATMAMICEIDPLLPFKVRCSVFRKRIRAAVFGRK